MYVRIVGFDAEGNKRTEFQGELAGATLGTVVASCVAAPSLAWVSVCVGKNAEKYYQVEKDYSWRRLW